MLAVSFTAAVTFWGVTLAGLWAKPLQGPGRPNLSVGLAVTASVAAIFLFALLELRRRNPDDDRLRTEREELRKDTEAMLRLAAAIVSLHGGRAPAVPRPLTLVQQSPPTERAEAA